jgi:hypothetical protein
MNFTGAPHTMVSMYYEMFADLLYNTIAKTRDVIGEILSKIFSVI